MVWLVFNTKTEDKNYDLYLMRFYLKGFPVRVPNYFHSHWSEIQGQIDSQGRSRIRPEKPLDLPAIK
jgi:hypothetical protein